MSPDVRLGSEHFGRCPGPRWVAELGGRPGSETTTWARDP